MNSIPKPTISPKLALTAILSASLTCVLSAIYIALCVLALIFRFNCNAIDVDSVSGSSFFITTIYRVYFQADECETAITQLGVTSDYSVFVLVAITLSAAVVSLIVAGILIAALTSETENQYITILACGYVGISIASLAVDLTLAVHFGMDHTYLTEVMNNSSPGLLLNYERDMIRIGAFLLMVVSLKGFLGHFINVTLLVMLVIYLLEYTRSLKQYEHSMHKLSVIKAFEPKRPRESILYRCDTCQNHSLNGGPHQNLGYTNDDDQPRSLMRENSRRDIDEYPTPSLDRSYSWQPAPATAPRPFSYLEEAKRPIPRSPSSATAEPQWRRNPWQGQAPPVPAPDYSPQAPRRLKSALKPAYM